MGICFAEYLPVLASVLQNGVQRWNFSGLPPAYEPVFAALGILGAQERMSARGIRLYVNLDISNRFADRPGRLDQAV